MPLVGTWRLSLIDRLQALDYIQVHLIPNTPLRVHGATPSLGRARPAEAGRLIR
jgi:hypothetical protein